MNLISTNKSLFFLGLLGLISIASCQKNTQSQSSKLTEKLAPSDFFFLQRAYPDAAFDFRAYQKALQSVASAIDTRSTFPGFDEEWTTQGPGNIGARVNTIAVDPTNDRIVYAGYAHGGVFKTTDGGATWVPVFDNQAFLSIGDIEIDPQKPKTVYVGTGDVNIPGGFFIGDGVYKSTDGGQTWKNVGLKEQGIIAKILVNPKNSDEVFAAAMGIPSVKDANRGLYKSSDGGTTWNKVLHISDQAGIVDMVINPVNPRFIYASSWNRYRTNFESVVAGPKSGIWTSRDGGATWLQLVNDLPTDSLGRVGLAMSGLNPNVLFAMYVGADSEFHSLYKTETAGETWDLIADLEDFEKVGEGSPLGGFGWYFGKVRVNPKNDNDIFILGVDLWRTTDGGQNWQRATPPWWQYSVHADKHDLVFTKADSIILGTDGGIYRTDVVGQFWTDMENIATTQFYRVAYNPHFPDLYYGGAQDNGTSGGNANAINNWERLWGGDGFQPAFHPTDPNTYYFETQNGSINGTKDNGNEWFDADQGLNSDRKNWDMPYLLSPHNPMIVYAGTYRLQRNRNGGEGNYQPVTPDLTNGIDDRYHNVSSLDESKKVEGLIIAGTSDGKVWVLDVKSNIFTEVSNGLPNRYVTSVKASPDNANYIYATHSGYKYNEYIPRVHRSRSRGAIWDDISGDLPNLAVNDIFVLPGHADSVLFVGTDGGVYGTLNGGKSWGRLGTNMPIIPVFDLDFNSIRNELIAGTYARSIMSYSLNPILGPVSVEEKKQPVAGNFGTNGLKIFPNPAQEFVEIEYLNAENGRDAHIVVLDAQGKMVRQQKEKGSGKMKSRLAIDDLPKGNYFVKVKVRRSVFSGKFTKAG